MLGTGIRVGLDVSMVTLNAGMLLLENVFAVSDSNGQIKRKTSPVHLQLLCPAFYQSTLFSSCKRSEFRFYFSMDSLCGLEQLTLTSSLPHQSNEEKYSLL